MNVTKQINLNECGICALNSVYEHYYGRNIKDKLLEESNIKTQGLSLYDFEKLAIKHGIFCETYKMDNKEFKDLRTKDYFVCLMKQDNGYHYVVAKKTNRDVQIYDSATGKYATRYEEFFEKFSGILILVSKTSIKQNEIKKQNIYDWKFILTLTVLNVGMILISIVCAKYINTIVNCLYVSYEIKEIIQISYIFLMFYISGDLIGLVSKIIQAKKYKILFQKYTDEFINCIGNKKNDFTSKVDKNNLYLVEHAIQSICSYQCFELPNFICSIFFSTVLLFFISFIHYQYFIFCIISILVVLAETMIKMKYTDSLCKKTIDNCLTNSGVINQTVQYIYSAANNFLQLDKIKKHFKSNYHEYSNIYIKNNIFSNWTDFILSFFEKIIFIAIVIAYVYASKGSSASNLIFICGIFGMFWGNIKNVSGYFIDKVQYKRFEQIYSNIINVGNKKNNCKAITEKINLITFIDKNKVSLKNGGIYNGKINLPCVLSQNIENNIQLKLNDTSLDEYSTDSIFIFDVVQENDLNDELVNNKNFIELLKSFPIDLRKNNMLNQQIINVANLLSIKNKIICFNENFKYIDENLREFFEDNIQPKIMKENFVLFYNN